MSPQHGDPKRWLGRRCNFDHEGKRLSGVIVEAKPNGFTQRGNIPDFLITVRGQSGKTLTISLVESYTSTHD